MIDTTNNDPDNIVTVAAIAILAFIFADVGHHVIGHGLTCLVTGGHILVLTASLFHCTAASRMIDAGGPLMNLLLAALMWFALQTRRQYRPEMRLFLILSFVFNLFWGSGQMVYSALLNKDDWAFALRGMLPDGIWRPALVLLGCFLYFTAMKVLMRELWLFGGTDTIRSEIRRRRILLVSYCSAGVLACAAAVLYQPDPFGSVREVALETFALNAGLLFALRRTGSTRQSLAPTAAILFNSWWIYAAVAVYGIFAATLCRGL